MLWAQIVAAGKASVVRIGKSEVCAVGICCLSFGDTKNRFLGLLPHLVPDYSIGAGGTSNAHVRKVGLSHAPT